jgi:two-component system nitrogen regulation sensor histidine kinase NtrY
MALRSKFILYLILVHLVYAGLAVYLLLEHRIWLLAVEALFAVTLTAGMKLIRSLFGTLDLISTGTEFIGDGDFTTRFREVGQPEMDSLVAVYNKMVDHLREERTRLQEQHYFLDKIVTASPSGIVTFDFDGRISTANPAAAQLLQVPAEELIGKKLLEIDRALAAELQMLRPGDSRVVPLMGGRRVKCQKSQFLDRGFPRDFVLVEELTEELRRSEKAAYEKLIRMMSHEVNNSIGSANSLLHSCLNYKDQLATEDREDFVTALAVVISRTGQLNLFMKRFADVVRLPAPSLYLCDVERLLREISQLMKSETSRREIAWRWEIAEQLRPILMDKGQMEQVFVNIVKNAIEAIGQKGQITIRMGRTAGKQFATIDDTGAGISPDVRQYLFTPFFSTKENGQGIGLTLVQEILDRHRFEFSLESPAGGPTQFTIYFEDR